MAQDGKTLLIYAPVSLLRRDGVPVLEDQACNGLRLWAENFDRVIVMLPTDDGPAPENWVGLDRIGPALARIEFVPLPTAYRPDRFLRHLPAVRRQIRALIKRADYLGFAIGGLFGDWGSVACIEAQRMGRAHFVWTDRVESEVTRRGTGEGRWRDRLRARLTHRPMAWLERWVVRRAQLGLFHGRETFDAYAPYSPNPQLVHDIHIDRADHISADALAQKQAAAATGPLRLAYVGRADPMKGPLDWVAVLDRVAAAGVDFRAVWLGGGDDLEAMRARVATSGLAGRVALPGFTRDRGAVLDTLRGAQVFLFCHKTPELPRCLIEALVSAAPIVGYAGAFAQDLISGNGGGVLTPPGDVAALAAQVVALAQDRAGLADLIGRAARDGAPFDDETVFRHRSEMIRRYLAA